MVKKMSNSVRDIVRKNKCTGCFACYNICPFAAIKMELSPHGFYQPQIINSRCQNCRRCLQYCPVYHIQERAEISNKGVKALAYGAWSNDEQIRLASSSGGLFTELASLILESGGVVFGVGWNGQILQHLMVDNVEDLARLRGSKYLPSYVGKSYLQVSHYQKQGRKVLFAGTPCQVAALKGMVKNKNLVTVDVICHGVPSLLVFQKYLQSKIGASAVKAIDFRDKENGWKNYSIKITTIGNRVYNAIHKYDPFIVGFLKNLYLNTICYNCLFARLPRTGELTLGDFWGLDDNFDEKKGVSAVLVNNEEGELLFNKLINRGKITVFTTEIMTIAKGNVRLIDGRFQMPDAREKLLEDLNKMDFNEIEEKYIKPPTPNLVAKIIGILRKRELIIFGTGSACQRILALFCQKELSFKLKYFVDNNPQKWGKILFSKPVHSPKQLLREKKESVFIIVASSFFEEIKKQLEQIGFVENFHFVNGMDLLFIM